MSNITVRLLDRQVEIDSGTPVMEVLKHQRSNEDFPLIAARINNEILSLHYRMDVTSDVEPVYLNSEEGLRVYRRSLCFLLELAFSHVSDETQELMIDHSLGNSFFYHFEKGTLDETFLQKLKTEMMHLVQQDLIITPLYISYCEARESFSGNGRQETALLLENWNRNRISVNRCGDYQTLYHGPMVSHTGLLNIWDLKEYHGGLRLCFSPSRTPLKLAEKEEPIPQLFQIYQEHKRWGKIRDVHCLGQLNQLSMNKREIEHFVTVSEALHMQKIGKIAAQIHKQKDSVKVVLIAGPSSSGKTTFTKKLSLSLQTLGFKPLLVSLDDYYLPHEQIPLDEDGKMDFEALEALDVPLLNENLLDLFAGKETEIPVFDFKAGGIRKEEGRKLRMEENSVLLMEGIHGLNSQLTERIDSKNKYKIYISALTQLNVDDYNRIATTDNRKIRRMVRDHQFRSYSALNTLKIFPSVIRGEKKNIFPFQGEADSMFNSALDYELGVLKIYAEPLLRSIRPTEREYSEACRLLSFLSNINPIPPVLVPRHSILREFIGDSGFHY